VSIYSRVKVIVGVYNMAIDYSKVKYGDDGKVSNPQDCPLTKHGFPEPTKVKFSTWTKEWKDAYYSYRGYGSRNNVDKVKPILEGFTELENELKGLKVPDSILDSVQRLKILVQKVNDKNTETYLTAIFGTETPKEGTTVQYLMVSVRGPNGERPQTLDEAKNFVVEGTIKYKASDIDKMVDKLKERGHNIKVDEVKKTITIISLKK
jgi:hypothetical protein